MKIYKMRLLGIACEIYLIWFGMESFGRALALNVAPLLISLIAVGTVVWTFNLWRSLVAYTDQIKQEKETGYTS